MSDYAQLQIELNRAALIFVEVMTFANASKLPEIQRLSFQSLKKAVEAFKEKTKPTRPDTGEDDFDSFHGTG